MKRRWKKSRFNVLSKTYDNELILYNSFTGAIGVVPESQKSTVKQFLRQGVIEESMIDQQPILEDLIDNGFFIPEEIDEFEEAARLHKEYYHNSKIMQLIIFPTEECNFRCVYCYESFLRGKMDPQVVEGIKNWVDQKIAGIDMLVISWFGGEPTEALDVIYDLSRYVIKKCAEHGVKYRSGMTTNGYNLRPEVFRRLVEECKVTNYQITIDGNQEHHDKKRIGKYGESTYDMIMSNLVYAKSTELSFSVNIRNNFDHENAKDIDLFLEDLADQLGHDHRFGLTFHPVGKWGGSNDDNLSVCGYKEAATLQYELYDHASRLGHRNSELIKSSLNPGGSVCYAAKPWSIAIGADGTLYKCTVALYDERNHVGKLLPDGTMQIDLERFDLWVEANESVDDGCQKCFFRPSCQGAACPLVRLDSGKSPCPTTKRYIKRTLTAVVGRS